MKNCFLQSIVVKPSWLGMSRMEVENWPQHMSTTKWINHMIMGDVLYSFSSVRVTR